MREYEQPLNFTSEIMNNLSSSMNNKNNNNSSALEWRRRRVFELSSQGYNQSEISKILQISQHTNKRMNESINKDKANFILIIYVHLK
jgi:DNA-binding NarL/FixJ family response regulator